VVLNICAQVLKDSRQDEPCPVSYVSEYAWK